LVQVPNRERDCNEKVGATFSEVRFIVYVSFVDKRILILARLPLPHILCQTSPMRRLTTIFLTLMSLLFIVTEGLGADFQKGYDAYYIARDYAAALREWKPLAEQGNADAQYYLGHMYRQGEGVPENDSAAAKWFTHAAQQGHANAQFYLSVMYYYGQGVDQDNVYAYMWWNIALSQGNPNAMDWRGIMEKRMTPSQIEKAEAFARECVSKNYKGC